MRVGLRPKNMFKYMNVGTVWRLVYIPLGNGRFIKITW